MEKQIEINNTGGIPTVSSLQVAKDFEKRHDHVIRDIEKILKTIKTQNWGLTPMFFENTYQAGTGKNYKYYEMTRDGFSLLAMGFTGKKALQWKLNYIDAFNLMETKLKEQSPPKQIEENTTIHTKKLTIKADSVNVENLNITNNYIEEKPTRKTSKKYRKGDTKFMDEYQKDFLRSQLEDFLQRMGIDAHKSVMGCPVCCDKDGFHFLPHSNRQYWKCFSAKHSAYPRDNGDIFELVAQMENISYSEAVNKVADMYNLSNFEDIPKFKAIPTDDEPKPQKDRIL